MLLRVLRGGYDLHGRLRRYGVLLRAPPVIAMPRGHRGQLQPRVTPGPILRTSLAALMLVALAAGCGGGSHHRAVTTAPLARGCPVTPANHDIPPGQEHNPGAKRATYYGNGQLWTVLWPHGVFDARRRDLTADGSISTKLPWWRGVRGALTITGRRLDKPAPGLRADITSGYGLTGFQSTGITFSTVGCWEVTGAAGDARLSFVMRVRMAQRQ
jgi:hypothetical protein